MLYYHLLRLTLFSSVSVVYALRTIAVFSVPSTEPPFAAAVVLAVRVALCGSGPVRERELRTTPPVPSPGPFPVLGSVRVRPVVGAGGAGAVLVPGPAVAPLAAARVVAGAVALAGGPVLQGEAGAAPSVHPNLALKQGYHLRSSTPRINQV